MSPDSKSRTMPTRQTGTFIDRGTWINMGFALSLVALISGAIWTFSDLKIEMRVHQGIVLTRLDVVDAALSNLALRIDQRRAETTAAMEALRIAMDQLRDRITKLESSNEVKDK